MANHLGWDAPVEAPELKAVVCNRYRQRPTLAPVDPNTRSLGYMIGTKAASPIKLETHCIWHAGGSHQAGADGGTNPAGDGLTATLTETAYRCSAPVPAGQTKRRLLKASHLAAAGLA